MNAYTIVFPTIVAGITIVLCLVILFIVNRVELAPRILRYAPKMENARPWRILLGVTAIVDLCMRVASIYRRVRLSDWSFFSLRIIAPATSPRRDQADKRFGIRAVDAILPPGGC